MLINSILDFQNIRKLIISYRKFFLFIGAGAVCSIIDIGLFMIFMNLSIPIIPSAILSLFFANILSYYLSTLIFAPGQKHSLRSVISFAVLVLAGIILTWVVMHLWLTYVGIYPLLGKLIAGFGVMIGGYFGRKFFVFNSIT